MREYIPHKKPLPYLIVKDYFSKKNVDLMLKELEFLTSSKKMGYSPPMNMAEGTKKNNQIGLDESYRNREVSDILMSLDKIYDDKKLIEMLFDMSFFYKCWFHTNYDSTLLAYYENSDYYKAHQDMAVVSIMYWLWKEPKSFEGGNIYLPEYDIKVPVERNQLMIMPSSTEHAVTEVKMKSKFEFGSTPQYNTTKFSGDGRYCIFRFLYVLPLHLAQNS